MTLKTLGKCALLRIVGVEIFSGATESQLCTFVQTCHFLAHAHLGVVLTVPKAGSNKGFLGRALEKVAKIRIVLTQCPAAWCATRAQRLFAYAILVYPAGSALNKGNNLKKY